MTAGLAGSGIVFQDRKDSMEGPGARELTVVVAIFCPDCSSHVFSPSSAATS